MTVDNKRNSRRKMLTAMGLGIASSATLASTSSIAQSKSTTNTQFAYAKDYQSDTDLKDDTHALQKLCEHAGKYNKVAVLENRKYRITAPLLSTSQYKHFAITCLSGQAEIEMVDTVAETVFELHSLQTFSMSNISINADRKVATAVELRCADRDIDTFCYVHINAVKIAHCYRTTQSKAAAGIMIIGAFDAVEIHNCNITDVTRKSGESESTGIAVAQTNGIVDLQNCLIQNITAPDDKDADGVKVFAENMQISTTKLNAQVNISNCRFIDCQGRSIKLQVTDSTINANTFELNNNFSTITHGSFIDCQADNGTVCNNTFYIHDAELGTGFSCVSFQNIRNTIGKASFCSHNFIHTDCALPHFIMAFSKYKTSQVIVDKNIIEGIGCDRFLLHRLYKQNTPDFDYARIALIDNSITFNAKNDKACLFYDWNHEIYDNTLLLHITGNTCTNLDKVGRVFINQKGFNAGNNFLLSNNVNFDNVVNWLFNLDKLPTGNDIIATHDQVLNANVNNNAPYYITTSNLQQYVTFGTTDKSFTRKMDLVTRNWKEWVMK